MALTGAVRDRLLRRAAADPARVAGASSRRGVGAATASCSRCSARRSSPPTGMPTLPRGARGARRGLRHRRALRRPAPDPRRHRRAAARADGRAGDPGVGDRQGARARARRPARLDGAAPSVTSPDFAVEYAGGHGPARAHRLGRRHHLPGLPARDGAVARGQREDHRRRHLRPDAPRAARAGARTSARRARRTRSEGRRTRSTSSCAAPTSCSAPRTSSATSGSASSPARAGSTRRSTTRTRASTPCSRSCPFGIEDEPPGPAPARDQGRRRPASGRTTR